ncbi:MAG: hypothetical protein WAO83_23735 [Fuerstiella sp.]
MAVSDHSESLPGDYRVRHYVDAVDKQGRLEIEVNEIERSIGELHQWFVFINGEIINNSKQQSGGNATAIQYRFEAGRWVLSNG